MWASTAGTVADIGACDATEAFAPFGSSVLEVLTGTIANAEAGGADLMRPALKALAALSECVDTELYARFAAMAVPIAGRMASLEPQLTVSNDDDAEGVVVNVPGAGKQVSTFICVGAVLTKLYRSGTSILLNCRTRLWALRL